MTQLSVVFMGGRQAGCVGLLTLFGAECRVLGAVAYDAPVKTLAEALRVPTFESILDPGVRALLGRADLLVSVHGREVVPEDLLRLPVHGGINVHPCLSVYKGAHPIERLLRDQHPTASVGVHRMTSQVDAGEALVEQFVDVAGKRSADEVYNALYPVYAITLLTALQRLRQAHESALPR